MLLRRQVPGIFVAAVFVCGSGGAVLAAEPDMREQARAHYDMGTGAYVRADYKTAAQEFSLADRMSPSTVALSAALDAALQADLPALGMDLVQRSTRAPLDAPLATLVGRARARFGKRVGRVRVICTPQPCTARVDGVTIELEKDQFVTVGHHTVETDRGSAVDEQAVDVASEKRVEVTVHADFDAAAPVVTSETQAAPSPQAQATAPATEAPAPATTSTGLSPTWFFAGVGLTAVLGGATLVSGLDAMHKHDDYLASGCDKTAAAGCADSASRGQDAQVRTNVMLAVTGAAAATTAVVGLFFTRWRADVSATVTGRAAMAFVRVRLP